MRGGGRGDKGRGEDEGRGKRDNSPLHFVSSPCLTEGGLDLLRQT